MNTRGADLDNTPDRVRCLADGGSFRALSELSPEFVAVLDASGLIAYASPAVERVLGYRVDEVEGHRVSSFVHPEDRAEADAFLESLLRTSSVLTATRRYRHKDGSWRVLEILGRNHGHGLDRGSLLVSTRDITERVEQEQRLREALAEADDLYHQASCGYHSLDAQGRVLRMNDTELRWLGYAREEVIGVMNFRELLEPASQAVFDRNFEAFKRSGELRNLEFELRGRQGQTMPVLLTATAIRDAEGRYIGSRSAVFDISQRRSAERALERVNRALRVRNDVNAALVRAEREAEFLEAVCRVIVDPGGYRMAWVGSAQNDRDQSVRVEAQAGFEDGYLLAANITWADRERGRGPTGTAIRLGQPQINRDFLHNPATAPWRREALARGFQSSIALPLREAGHVMGCLTLYAAEPDAFDAEETQLLIDLAQDVEFGIRMLRAARNLRFTQAAVERLAYCDTHTGLPNRTRLLQQIDEQVERTGSAQAPFAVLTLVVERFNDIQAGLGIAQTEQLMSDVVNRLQVALEEGESLSRISSESFAVLQVPADAARVRRCASSVHELMQRPFQCASLPISVQLCIGAALAPQHGQDAELLLVRSGSAARRARRTASRIHLFDGMALAEDPHRLALISDLRRAIESGEIRPMYQPKIDLQSTRVCGAEALVRWTHPQRGPISPTSFIPLAEQTGLIRPLTRHVLAVVVKQIADWRDDGQPLWPLAVNVSARDFDDAGFVDAIFQMLDRHGVAPEWLRLELTESTLMDDAERVREQLLRLAQRGIALSIDDFGTGYSSLSYVADLPIRSLKIDRSFVIQMMHSPRVHSVVAATISLAQALGLRVIAEGVDEHAQAEELRRLGCHELQGFLYSPAIPAEKFQSWVQQFEQGSRAPA